MKKPALLALLVALLALPTQRAEAQTVFSIGGHFGVDLDQDATFAGALARLDLGLPLTFQPGVDFGLNENSSYTRAEGSLLYYIGDEFTTTFTPYVGAGAALIWRDTDSGENEFDVGPNIVGGIEFRPLGPGIVPYAQARYTILQGADPLGIMGGILLRFGGL